MVFHSKNLNFKKITSNILFLLKLPILVILPVFCLFIIVSYLDINYLTTLPRFTASPKKHHTNITDINYLIDTPKCKIPAVDPFVEEVKSVYPLQKYIPCFKKPPLTYIKKNDNIVTLNINQSVLDSYSIFRPFCCYAKITHRSTAEEPDNSIKIGRCVPFFKSVIVQHPVILVKCKNIFFQEVYSNVHAIINAQPTLKNKSEVSVLMVGVDSVSKLNLMRSMPETYNFLEENDFISLKGYTKIDHNTLPNLLGMLSGQSVTQARETCNFEYSINSCSLIWNKFKKINYVTAYAEDVASLSTFNYKMKGFAHPPTDFYFRDYILAAESLYKHHKKFCTSPEPQRMLNLVTDFQITLKNNPKFGLFWLNSFNQEDFNLPSAMDKKIEKWLTELYKNLDNTIFFFFSDCGLKYNKPTQTGWLEERLPFFYIHLPKSFQKKWPVQAKNLAINSKRLTNAFDVYMTLQHILFLADEKYIIENSLACPKCHSLFKEVSEERTCKDVAIDKNWCVCNARSYVSPKTKIVKEAGLFLVDEINKLIESSPHGYNCYFYGFNKIIYSGISQFVTDNNVTKSVLLVRIKTKPKAEFEASILVSSENLIPKFQIVGDVSRLDKYDSYAKCVKDTKLEKYCFCRNRLVFSVFGK